MSLASAARYSENSLMLLCEICLKPRSLFGQITCRDGSLAQVAVWPELRSRVHLLTGPAGYCVTDTQDACAASLRDLRPLSNSAGFHPE